MEEMKKKFSAELEIILLEEDVLTASGSCTDCWVCEDCLCDDRDIEPIPDIDPRL